MDEEVLASVHRLRLEFSIRMEVRSSLKKFSKGVYRMDVFPTDLPATANRRF